MKNIVHLYWEGPIKLSKTSMYNDRSKDFGIYQVYGNHPIYGMDALLYIGKACKQTFLMRIKQHEYEIDEYNEGDRQFYIGRLTGLKNIVQDKWDHLISLTEKLLINSHTPAFNSSNINELNQETDKSLQDLHILNWGNYAKLLPEVSGDRWTNKWVSDKEYKPFKRE